MIDPYREDQAVYDLSAEQLVPAEQAVVSYFRRAATATVG